MLLVFYLYLFENVNSARPTDTEMSLSLTSHSDWEVVGPARNRPGETVANHGIDCLCSTNRI